MTDVKTYRVDYTNHRGERRVYKLRDCYFFEGASEYYPDHQMLMRAVDADRNVTRTFSVKGIHSWEGAPSAVKPAPEVRVVTVTFPQEVHLPLGFERQLDALVEGVCQQFMQDNPTLVMWPAGRGNAPIWNEPHEPTFDPSTYQVECAVKNDSDGSNPWNPRAAEQRAEAREEFKRRKAERKAKEEGTPHV